MLLNLVHLGVNDLSLAISESYKLLFGLLMALQGIGFEFIFYELAVVAWLF